MPEATEEELEAFLDKEMPAFIEQWSENEDLDASRGVILRYASWSELWPHAVVLWSMGLGIFIGSMLMFRKRL